MNNEIKEILEYLKANNNYDVGYGDYEKSLYKCDIKLLLDYIINLQQENAELKAICKRPTPIDYAMIQKRYDDYKSRCEKASEYVNKEFKDEPYSVFIYGKTNIDNLLNILQNGSDEDEK